MFTYDLSNRKNSVSKWAPIDSEKTYSLTQPDKTPNYSKTDIEYVYNSDGFRCDEFSADSELPITFLGCSFTEGIGLPLHHTWPHFLIDIIKQQTRYKNIPHHSIALSGSGIDSAANILPKIAKKTSPRLILGFFNSLYQRDYCVSDLNIKHWVHADAQESWFKHEINRVFSDKYFALHQTHRSLKIIDLVAQLHNAEATIMFLNDGSETELSSTDFSSLKIKYCTIDNVLPAPLPQPAPKLARDNKHPGANWQYTVATHVADAVLPSIISDYQKFHAINKAILTTQNINPAAIKVFKRLPDKGWPS